MSEALTTTPKHQFKALGLAVIETELQAIQALKSRIDHDFSKACDILLHCQGRIVVTGMGKSGHIARKVAATFASTGSPAFFMHPAEAGHGDFGMITSKDVVLALSNSGTTTEIMTLLPLIERLGIKLIALTGNSQSIIAATADVNIDVSVAKEACPLGLAPTASTTAALVMGDALAIALLEARGFTEQDFAFSHPSGRLGKRLLIHIDSIMRTEQALPRVYPDMLLADTLVEMSRKGLGMTAVVDHDDQLLGVYTDGDLRRTLDKGVDVHQVLIKDCMTKHAKTIQPSMLAAKALNIMEEYKITCLLVTNAKNQLIGAVHIHDLLQAGVV